MADAAVVIYRKAKRSVVRSLIGRQCVQSISAGRATCRVLAEMHRCPGDVRTDAVDFFNAWLHFGSAFWT